MSNYTKTMDANEFLMKLGAKVNSDLKKDFFEYKVILAQLPPNVRGLFSLNVLYVISRNLDKEPRLRSNIDNKALLVLSIDCIRETQAMGQADQVKILACIYRIHQHVLNQSSPIPFKLILQISSIPFEVEPEHFLTEYSKTYWNILVDRLSYIEKLRNEIPIIKLLPKLTNDVIKLIKIYDTLQFCSSILVFLVKKIYDLYKDKHAQDLNHVFKKIFSTLAAKDMKPLKRLVDIEAVIIYVKLNECLCIIAENASKTYFKDSPLDSVIRTCVSIIGHSPDILHCFQTYSNQFCSILTTQNTTNTHLIYSITVLNSLLVSLETTLKLGYIRAMTATFPILNEFLRLYIEYNVTNSAKKPWKDHFNIQLQEICLKLMKVLMKKMNNCDQLLTCDNCEVKSGLHDSLRLSFLVKHFIMVSLSQNMLIKDTLPLINDIIIKQYQVLTKLNDLGCVNYRKYFKKMQTDLNNSAISLCEAKYYEFSIKLFDLYIQYEIKTFTEHKNVSEALYNKSICEGYSQLYKSALVDAFLSSLFSNDGLRSKKHLILVVETKAKVSMSATDNEDGSNTESLQLFSILDAVETALEEKMYGNISPYLMTLKLRDFLKHEFAMYAKLSLSVAPIAGVWKSLLKLYKGKCKIKDETEEALWLLYEVITETPTVVETMISDHFKDVLTELLEDFDEGSLTPDLRVVYASLLFLKAEIELTAARPNTPILTEAGQSSNPVQITETRTIPQEFAATKSAERAVSILAELSPDFGTVSNTKCLENSLHIYCVFVQLLIHLARDLEGLQLARMCCLIAECVRNNEAYIRNMGTLLYHGSSNPALKSMLTHAYELSQELPLGETVIIFTCDASIYYSGLGMEAKAARLIELAQNQISSFNEDNPQLNLDLAVGRLMEAQGRLCKNSGSDTLTEMFRTIQHYQKIDCTAGAERQWHRHSLYAWTLRSHYFFVSWCASRVARGLRDWSRAEAVATAARPSIAATARAAIYAETTNTCTIDDAQIKIYRLKHFLGPHSLNETQPPQATAEPENLEPKEKSETTHENSMFRKAQTLTSIPSTSVPTFIAPEWFRHPTTCECCACSMPAYCVLTCQSSGLEASMYVSANKNNIARNYFNGVMEMLPLIEARFNSIKIRYSAFDEIVVDCGMRRYWDWYRRVKLEILKELSFFELKNKNYDLADEHIVEIYSILRELNVDRYFTNDILSLLNRSGRRKRIIEITPKSSSEDELPALTLTAERHEKPLKTPITAMQVSRVTAEPNEPVTSKAINFDEGSGEKEVKELNVSGEAEFNVPEPTTDEHFLEAGPSRTKSSQSNKVTQPSNEQATPLRSNALSTLTTSTPDKFFTPMTTTKTKKTTTPGVVKNLEHDFFANMDDPHLETQVLEFTYVTKITRLTVLKREESDMSKNASGAKE